ncbi:MAG: DUF5106 domain-containing protein [Bacteroidales bacterium]
MSKKINVITCFGLALLLTFSCKYVVKQTKIDNNFPMVKMPSLIISKNDAAKFLVNNFWNDFLNPKRLAELQKDSVLVLGVDSIKFEEAFAKYAGTLCFLQSVDYNTTTIAIKKLFNIADSIAIAGDSTFLFTLVTLGEKYFYNPNSPMLNEEVYISVLEGVLASNAISGLNKMQYEYQLNISKLNRVGSKGADFGYQKLVSQNNGKDIFAKGSLYTIKADYTIIFFNNPNCQSCSEILEVLKSAPIIQQLIAKAKLKILAMYIDEDVISWSNNYKKYPSNWIYAYDNQYILRDNNLYGLRAIPSLYLLDKDKKVLLKDVDINILVNYLLNLNNSL